MEIHWTAQSHIYIYGHGETIEIDGYHIIHGILIVNCELSQSTE